jgi:hypothetical protein
MMLITKEFGDLASVKSCSKTKETAQCAVSFIFEIIHPKVQRDRLSNLYVTLSTIEQLMEFLAKMLILSRQWTTLWHLR